MPGNSGEPDPGKLAENYAEVLSDGVGFLVQVFFGTLALVIPLWFTFPAIPS